jgi:hypothetical protein
MSLECVCARTHWLMASAIGRCADYACGRGPTSDISPFSTLNSCGSAENLVLGTALLLLALPLMVAIAVAISRGDLYGTRGAASTWSLGNGVGGSRTGS